MKNDMERLRNEIIMELEDNPDQLERIVEKKVMQYTRGMFVNYKQKVQLEKQLINSIEGFDAIQPLLEDDEITEIMINGADSIFYEKDGRIYNSLFHFSSQEKLNDLIQRIAGENNRSVNMASPIVDTRLADGSRVNVVLAPVALNGPIVSIRKFPKEKLTMEKLIEYHALSAEVAEYLRMLVYAGYNILISGGTGAGKTTMLNALSGYIHKEERIITIEDSAELQIEGIENLVRLETRNANASGCEAITIRDLIRCALRMRPDRLVIGEIRGVEAVDLLQALNTGHEGALCTIHSNSCQDVISRLEMMVLMGLEIPLPAIRAQICAGIDIILQVERLRDKSRKLTAVYEVVGMEQGEVCLQPLYEFVEKKSDSKKVVGTYEKKGRLIHKEKLRRAGLSEESVS